MLIPDAGAVTAAAKAVELSIERIREIGTTTMAQLEAATSEGTTTFTNIEPSAAHFSSVPLAAEFHAQQQAAKEAFLAAIEGILSDLRSFGDNLVATADAHQQTDDQVRAALMSFGEQYVDADLATNTAYEEHREDAALNSTGAQEADEAAGFADEGGEGGSEPQAPTDQSGDAPQSDSGDSSGDSYGDTDGSGGSGESGGSGGSGYGSD